MRSLLLVLFGVPLTGVFVLLAIAGGPFRARRHYYDWIHHTWSRWMLRLAGVRVEVEGLESLPAGEPVILMSNHQSLIDIFVLLAEMPVSLRFVAKKEIGRVPVFARAMRNAGHVFIDRQNRSDSARALNDAVSRIEQRGFSMAVFPEATRSVDGRLLPFKKGSFRAAIDSGATLVPVALDGGWIILPKTTLRVRSGLVRVRCGQPIRLAGQTQEIREQLVERVRAEVSAMLDEIRVAPLPAIDVT